MAQKKKVVKKLSFEPADHTVDEVSDEPAASQAGKPPSSSPAVHRPAALLGMLGDGVYFQGSATQMGQLPDSCVGLVVTTLCQNRKRNTEAEKDYRAELRDVFVECKRVLETGGRIAIGLASAGHVFGESFTSEIVSLLRDDLQLLVRGEIVWQKAKGAVGAHAWGSFAKASNPRLRVKTERIVVFSKESEARALTVKERRDQGLPFESTITNDEFLEAACDLWRIDPVTAEERSLPVDVAKRLIDLYSYEGDIVLDPFAGSGATLVAAAAAGRIGVGYDSDVQNVERGQRRLADEVGPLLRKRKNYGAAVSLASSAKDIARTALEKAGFFVLESKTHRLAAACVLFDFCVRNTFGQSWWVDVVGGYTGVNPGLTDHSVAVELVGRAAIACGSEKAYPVLALTSALPLQGAKAQKALVAAGPQKLFDVIDLLDPPGLDRLVHYGDGGAQQPGFWSTEALSKH